MEPKNHPIEKEKHLNQAFIFVFHVNVQEGTDKDFRHERWDEFILNTESLV